VPLVRHTFIAHVLPRNHGARNSIRRGRANGSEKRRAWTRRRPDLVFARLFR
jgi:hypothetical protein